MKRKPVRSQATVEAAPDRSARPDHSATEPDVAAVVEAEFYRIRRVIVMAATAIENADQKLSHDATDAISYTLIETAEALSNLESIVVDWVHNTKGGAR